MVTTDKDISIYSCICISCGKKIEFASNQPAGDYVPHMCECGHRYSSKLVSDDTCKYKVRMRDDTRRIREGILEIFYRIGRPMTVRQVFYQSIYSGLVPKDEKHGYQVIQRNILEMRRCGHLPYFLISDLTRRMVKPESYNGLTEAFDNWMTYYRQDVWANQTDHIEIWLEKDALAGIFAEITRKYDVPLFVARGFSSESFLYSTSQEIKRINKPTYVYYFSDYDDAGDQMAEQVKTRLPKFGVEVNFTRAALTPELISYYDLPSRPAKQKVNKRTGKIRESKIQRPTELDAMQPGDLHDLIEDCILNHISKKDLENIMMEETVQKETLQKIQNNIRLA